MLDRAAQTSSRFVARWPWLVWWPVFVPMLLAIFGVLLIILLLPAAQRNRQVWLYQQERMEKGLQEYKDIQNRNDPAARKRIKYLEYWLFSSSGWNPESFRSRYQKVMIFIYFGAFSILAAVAIPIVRWRMTGRMGP